ncbi:MAG: acyltransferase [Edaphobacter sp.]
MLTPRAPSKIVPLTSARFFAALYVVLYHGVSGIPSQRGCHDLFTRVVGLGYVSVSFFFMLSGFILAIAYLKDDRPVSKRKFFVRRFARIYPLYIAALALDLPRFVLSQRHMGTGFEHTIGWIVASILLIQAWFANLVGLNDPSWSLSAEAFFYFIFPFVGAALWKMRGRTMLWLSLLVYLGGIWLVEIVNGMELHARKQSYDPVPHLFIFLLGICLARLSVWISENPERLQRLQQYAPWMLLGSSATVLAIPVFDLQIPEILMQHGLLAPLFGLMILAFASGNRLISSLFSANWLVVLGEGSYALYLIHVPIGAIFRRWIERYDAPMFLVYVGVTVGLSVVILKCLETPARRWILEKERVHSLKTEDTDALIASTR